MSEPSVEMSPLWAILDAYEKDALAEVRLRWNAWSTDLENTVVREVVGALLARQATLAIELVRNPSLWTGHLAPLFLRAMADVHISLAWISQDPTQRSQSFVGYGLGQVKLQIERHKQTWPDEPPDDQEKAMVGFLERWLDSQRYSFFTEVNVGSWSQKSVRDMAQEAGIGDFYDYVYTPFSACTHSMWHHVEQYNLKRCRNPLHGYHRVPTIVDLGPEADNALLAAKYLDKSIRTFDDAFGVKIECESSRENLSRGLEAVLAVPDEEPGEV